MSDRCSPGDQLFAKLGKLDQQVIAPNFIFHFELVGITKNVLKMMEQVEKLCFAATGHERRVYRKY